VQLLPLTLEIRRSRRLMASLLLAHLLVAAGLWPTELPLWTKVVLWVALAVSPVVALRRPHPVALTLQANGRLTMIQPDGASVECRVQPATTVFPWLVVLLLESPGRKVRLALPVDALGAEGHRRLRAWLKWKASAGSV
jgi:hypothetical protein